MTIACKASDLQCDEFGQEHGEIYEILRCPKCDKPTIRSGFWYDGMEEYEWTPSVLYPSERKRLLGLPGSVAKAYEAASAVAQVDANAYAVMLGRVLDAVAIDRGAVGRTLALRLKDLAEKGEIPKNIADMAHSIKQFRNVGAHGDLGVLTDEEIPFLEALSNSVLEYVYVAPRLVAMTEGRLKAVKNGAKDAPSG